MLSKPVHSFRSTWEFATIIRATSLKAAEMLPYSPKPYTWVVVKIMVPFWGTLNIKCRIILGIQKGAIILKTTYIHITRGALRVALAVGFAKLPA